jgi:hypothetical protein
MMESGTRHSKQGRGSSILIFTPTPNFFAHVNCLSLGSCSQGLRGIKYCHHFSVQQHHHDKSAPNPFATMSSTFSQCFAAFLCRDRTTTELAKTATVSNDAHYISEKTVMRYHDNPEQCPKQELVTDLIDILYSASFTTSAIEHSLEDTVREAGWWDEAIAKAVLFALGKALEAGLVMGSAMKEAYDKAYGLALEMIEFAKEHPILTGVVCTIVALGVLVLLWPSIVAALGFGELGPVEGTQFECVAQHQLNMITGSFAAAWQSMYGARVPVGSLFSYLQKLGMTF